MQTEKVTAKAFEGVQIRRTGGYAGMDDEIRVTPNMVATITSRHAGEHTYELDEAAGQELLTALAKLADAPETERGERRPIPDAFQYDIELTWNGKVIHIHDADIGADDALHGVMYAANNLLTAVPERKGGMMQVHPVAQENPADEIELTWPPKNGNTGIVPPWLQKPVE